MENPTFLFAIRNATGYTQYFVTEQAENGSWAAVWTDDDFGGNRDIFERYVANGGDVSEWDYYADNVTTYTQVIDDAMDLHGNPDFIMLAESGNFCVESAPVIRKHFGIAGLRSIMHRLVTDDMNVDSYKGFVI